MKTSHIIIGSAVVGVVAFFLLARRSAKPSGVADIRATSATSGGFTGGARDVLGIAPVMSTPLSTTPTTPTASTAGTLATEIRRIAP